MPFPSQEEGGRLPDVGCRIRLPEVVPQLVQTHISLVLLSGPRA